MKLVQTFVRRLGVGGGVCGHKIRPHGCLVLVRLRFASVNLAFLKDLFYF